MQNLFILFKKLPVFLCIKWCDKKVLLEAFVLTAAARILIISVPFKSYHKHLGRYNEETPLETDMYTYKEIKKVSWAISIISRYTPWESKCLVQAVAAQRMLKNRNFSSTIYFGVNKDKDSALRAHAWLRCGELFVTGGDYKGNFMEVAKFAN